jgi:hypothetical protein
VWSTVWYVELLTEEKGESENDKTTLKLACALATMFSLVEITRAKVFILPERSVNAHMLASVWLAFHLGFVWP